MTNVQYTKRWVSGQIQDTIKYDQQSLSSLAKNANKTEKINLRQSCRRFNSLSEESKNWVLDYLYGVKGVISYEKIKLFDDLDCAPNGEFFTKAGFCSSLRNEIVTSEGYENVKNKANYASKEILICFWLPQGQL